MKNKLFTKLLVTTTAVSLVAGTLTGCGKANTDDIDEDVIEEEKEEKSSKNDADKLKKEAVSFEDNELLSFIKGNFQSTTLEEEYQKTQYNLPKDYVFEFPCEDEAGYIAYDVFEVYGSSNFKDHSMTYNVNTYEDGVIKVAPRNAVKLDDVKSSNVNDGTWGSLNQLYLVQYYDLKTGEELEKPIVTPFTVEHDLKAPVVSQGVNEKNSYKLSWKPVEGATKYAVYSFYGGCTYDLCCVTTDTSVVVEDFERQQETDNLMSLFKNDLEASGMTVDKEGVFSMNDAVMYDSDDDGLFTVVAIGKDGKTSGISNYADVRELASMLPHTVTESVMEVNISKIEDVPAYVNVEMVDGSIAQMIIDYHGAQAYKYPDEPEKISVRAHVANTNFDSFYVVMNGMLYQDVVDQIKYVLDREDNLLKTVRPAEATMPAVEVIDETPEVKREDIKAEPEVEDEPEVIDEPEAEIEPEITDEPEELQAEADDIKDEPKKDDKKTSKKSTGNALMDEVASNVSQNLKYVGLDNVNKVVYANSDLESWMAYCLIGQSEVIPVPVDVFPEAANFDRLVLLFMEAYRQNPTSGVVDIASVQYNPKSECLIVPYVEDRQTRLNKTKEELVKAEEVVNSQINSSMSDYEKVYALNEYFRTNASYDFDSMSTDVDINNVSEAFIDAHTPYGILCKNYGVCESYSEAFILTSRMAGLESIAEIGSLFGGGHEWNRVKVDGNWCVLDITNNDNDAFVNGLFNLSDEQIEGILVPSPQAVVDASPFKASVVDKEYYYVNGLKADSLNDAKDMLAKQLKSSNTAIVRVPLGTSEEDAYDIMKDLANEGAGITKGAYNFGLVYVEK